MSFLNSFFRSSHFKLILRKIKPTYYPLQHASLFAKLLHVVFVKSQEKLLNCLMFGQTLSEVNMDMIKTFLSRDRVEDRRYPIF